MSSDKKTGLGGLAWPAALFILALATPPELSVNAGGLRLSAYRIVLLLSFLASIRKLFSGKVGSVHGADWLVILHSFWSMLALINYAGVGQGLETGGIYFIEALGAYLLGRCYIRNSADFAAMSRLMFMIVVIMSGFALIESVTGKHFIRETSRAILGGPSLVPIEPRMGLHRAYGSFDHPILFGIFCASSFALAFYLTVPHKRFRSKWARTMFTLGGTFFSLSAGAFSALGIQIFLVGWDLMTRNIGRRWSILGGIFAAIWTVISLSSNRSPIKVFLTYFTFSPGTGYNRIRIFDCGTAEIARHPLLGIGLGDWERPSWMVSGSMDNFWLATAVRYGLPAFLALAGALLWLSVSMSNRNYPSKDTQNSRAAWLVCMIGLSIAGSTVHYWNALFCLFAFLLGSGAWLALPESTKRPVPSSRSASQLEKERGMRHPTRRWQPC
ncbi:MAG: hypothetical protein DWH91_03200 [Planctomycetota bacterium]|nr:MAG: hypothetical protein DWH91_03200 [Planctomycetota bacterium]